MMHLCTMDEIIVYRGSVTDLATDVAGVLTIEQAKEFIKRMEHHIVKNPEKFRSPSN